MKRPASFVALVPALLAACGGVSHRVHEEVPAPATIAVLPFAGTADPSVRESARRLLHGRLTTRGFVLQELDWTDRVLSERGWLRDPEQFTLTGVPIAELLDALHADAVVAGTDVAETRFNTFLLRRHAVAGHLMITASDGREFWSADHSAGGYGGFLLTSGQVLTELKAQGEHGTPMATLALTDEWIADVSETVPAAANRPMPMAPPRIDRVAGRRQPLDGGEERIVVEADATAAANLRFTLAGVADGIPMVAVPGQPGHYRGAHDVPRASQMHEVRVSARDAFGRETTAEARL